MTADWVRMKSIFGLSVLPPESANIVVRAVNKAVALGHVSPNARWQIVEWWAASYLLDEFASHADVLGDPVDPWQAESAVSPVAAAEEMMALRALDDPREAEERSQALIRRILDSLGYEATTRQMELLHR